MKTLTTLAKEAVAFKLNATYRSVSHEKRNELREAIINEYQFRAHEMVEDFICSPDFPDRLLEILQEDDINDRAVLAKGIGQTLANCADDYCKALADAALEEARDAIQTEQAEPSPDREMLESYHFDLANYINSLNRMNRYY